MLSLMHEQQQSLYQSVRRHFFQCKLGNSGDYELEYY